MDIENYWDGNISDLRQAIVELRRLVEGTAYYQYGDKKWFSMSLTKRRGIIEDLFNDNAIQERFRLTDKEARHVLKVVKDEEA